MALLIPDSLRSNRVFPATVRRVAGALGTSLDNDVTVWYEPMFDRTDTRPDLVVLDPRYGVVVIELLKGADKSQLLGVVNGELRIASDGQEHSIPSPLIRADQFAASLRAALSAHPTLSKVPVGALAVFTNQTRESADAKRVGTVVDLDRCLFKPDLDLALSESDPAPMLRAFARAAGGALSTPLTDEALALLRGIIHPETIVNPRPMQGALFSAAAIDGDEVKVMDRKQERMAKSMGSGHRVIRGVAGSGKTLVLVSRARLLSQMLPSQKILVTCFTRSLASQLRKQLDDCPNVDVRNLDRVMDQAMRDAGVPHPGYSGGSIPVAKAALEALDKKEGPRFRAVLVDEAQDFDPEALQFCVRLLEASAPDEQDLIIVADSAQNIFKKNFRWKDAGVNAIGRTQVLRTNYRNTKQILAFAYAFLTADLSIEVQTTLDPDDDIGIIPAEASNRDGDQPRVVGADDVADEVAKAVAAVQDYYGTRSAARSIAVLYGEQPYGRESFAQSLSIALEKAGLPHFWVTDPDEKGNRDLAGETDAPIVLSTVHSAKGLEFPAVVACGLGARADLVTARKLAYVGMTRAINDLTVIVGSDSPFQTDLLPDWASTSPPR